MAEPESNTPDDTRKQLDAAHAALEELGIPPPGSPTFREQMKQLQWSAALAARIDSRPPLGADLSDVLFVTRRRDESGVDQVRYYAVVEMRMALADVQRMQRAELEAWVKTHQEVAKARADAEQVRQLQESKLGSALEKLGRDGVPVSVDFLGALGKASTGELAILSAARALAMEVVEGKLTAKMARGLLVGALKVPSSEANEILAGAHPYTPPPEVVARAEALIAAAAPDELDDAGQGFAAYSSVTDNISSVTGDHLPSFEQVGPLVRTGWLVTTRRLHRIVLAHVVGVLNNALQADPEAVSALFRKRIPCNDVLAQHPSVQVRDEPEGGWTVGMLGLLNGVLAKLAGPGVREGLGPVVLLVNDGQEEIISRFALVDNGPCWRCNHSGPPTGGEGACGACGRAPLPADPEPQPEVQ